ncbi:hypothetical protein HY469_05645 [Candidatus Roizmanbacteria bacterium]|nr:hypothetical protein [Candidatus Roizmanbacteria bacterium]
MDVDNLSLTDSPMNSAVSDESEYSPAPRRSHKGLIIFVIASLLFLVGAGFAIQFFLPQIFVTVFKEMSYSKSKTPWLYEVPVSRSITRPKNLSQYPIYTYYGITFRIPWSDEPEVTVHETNTMLKFDGEKTLVIRDPATAIDTAAAMTSGEESEQIQELFGAEHLENDYKFKKLILSTTPDQVSFLTPGREATVSVILITLKNGLYLVPDSRTVYDFHTENTVGFQYGEPGVDKGVFIDFYDEAYTPLSLIITGSTLTQTDIDSILSSISFEGEQSEESTSEDIPLTTTPGTSKTVQPTTVPPTVAPTQPPASPSNFVSAGAQTVEEGVTAHITSASVSGSQMTISVTFKNVSANEATVRPIRLSMYNDTHGTANKEGYLEVSLNPGESRSFTLTYDMLPSSPLIFKYATNTGVVDLGTYNQ